MSYFLYPPPDRSDEIEYAYWNGELETKESVDNMDNDFIKYLEEADAAPREYYESCEELSYYPTEEEMDELNRLTALQEENDEKFARGLYDLYCEIINYFQSAKKEGIFNRALAEGTIKIVSNTIEEFGDRNLDHMKGL